MVVRNGKDGAGAGASQAVRGKVGLAKGGGSGVFRNRTGTRRRDMLGAYATAKGGKAKLAHFGQEQVPSRGWRRGRRRRRRGGGGESECAVMVQASASLCVVLFGSGPCYIVSRVIKLHPDFSLGISIKIQDVVRRVG